MKTLILNILLATTLASQSAYSQIVCNEEPTHSGEATFYDFGIAGVGNCSLNHGEIKPFLIGAMNETDYANADYCGTCVAIDGPKGSVKVQIIDRCPECKPGDIDLSPEAFEKIAPLIDGRVPITWKTVPCQVTGNVKLFYKEGSNQWWTAVQVRNHTNQIAKLEFLENESYVELPRKRYNFFLKDDGMGVGPHTFRITDVYGNSIIEKDVPFEVTTETNGKNQFPTCSNTDEVVDKGNTSEETQGNVTAVTLESDAQQIEVIGKSIYFQDLHGNYQVLNLSGQVVSSGSIKPKVIINTHRAGVHVLKVFANSDLIINKKILLR